MDETVQQHFVCMACKGTSEMAGMCATDGCAQNGSPLTPCTCTDGMHAGSSEGSQPQEGGDQAETPAQPMM